MNSGNQERFDVVVIGCGAAGMTTALVAACQGLSVLIVEKTDLVGGNTSYSGGMVYIPNNPKMAPEGQSDERDAAIRYLDATVPTEDGRGQRLKFVEHGREAITFLERHTALQFKPVPFYPDYYPDLEGARDGMRVLEPEPFDASELGPWFRKLRPPIPEFTILGGMMIARPDLTHFQNVWRSPRSFLRVAQLVGQYALQRLKHHRGSHLVLGNALAGRMLKSLLDRKVTIMTRRQTSRVLSEDGVVVGIELEGPDGPQTIGARAVVLATGGFSNSTEKRQKFLPAKTSLDSPFAPGSTGDGLDLGVAAGGKIGDDNTNNAYWSPISIYQRANGRKTVYPHIITDRGKPGSIIVNAKGRRFVNEAISYHRFGEALLGKDGGPDNLPAFMICDRPFLRRYGLGAIKPLTANLSPYISSGYLKSARDWGELAEQIGVDPAALEATIEQFNAGAQRGEDPEFGRGKDVFSRYLGDQNAAINPSLAPIETPPYFAIEIGLSDLGTVAGLRVAEDCEVVNDQGDIIPGLYAVGNDMQSIMRGRYPGPGITLGPALTFGYLLGSHLAKRLQNA